MNKISFASVNRKAILFGALTIVALIFSVRLFQMQIINQKMYDEKSAGNSIKAIEQIPFRGVFYDRNLNLLVDNIPAYTLQITPADYDTNLNKILDAVLDFDEGTISNILKKNRIYSKYVPIRIKRGIDFKVVSWLEENSNYLSGVDYIVEMQRGYPFGVMGSHLFGYSKEISPKQYQQEKDYYRPGDYVGHTGIEKAYELELRGKKGFKYVLVDSKRKEIGRYKNGSVDRESIKGRDLVLSIDGYAQKTAEEEMKGKRGAVVAIEPATGEILALVSSPEFDLNQFSYVTTKEFLDKIYNDPNNPLFNRATMSLKPPGSTFKILAAIAALDMGVINANTTIYCGGGFTFGRFFKCHGSHGSINVTHAIEKSCNTFFYNLIYKIGLNNLKSYALEFGFSNKTGIDIGEESAGLITDESYYEKIYGKNWPRSIMASLGIGQGEISVTPLQLAYFTAITANNGISYKPHVVKGYLDNNTREIINYNFPVTKTSVKKEVFDIVKEGMFLVVNGHGTATHIRSDEFKIAGKTGTAQNPHGKDHALFIGFAPYENPKIAIAVVVENVGYGGTHAAPIAKRVIESYLTKGKSRNQQNQMITQVIQNGEEIAH